MATAEEYEKRIQTYGWNDLCDLWQQIEARDTPDFAAGKAFEYLVLRMFQLDGSDVRWPYRVIIEGTELEQIDGVIYISDIPFLVECKDENKNVAIEPMVKLRGQLQRRNPGIIGMLFSRLSFTTPALLNLQRYSPQNLLLWSGFEIVYALQRRRITDALKAKYRHCIEHGLPDFDTRLIK